MEKDEDGAAGRGRAGERLTMLITILLTAQLAAAPGPGYGCVEKWGRKVCGYDCQAHQGRVRCAKTPAGRCEVRHGVLRCWDPEPKRTGKRPPPPPDGAECLSAWGRTACGYGCKKAFGRIRCSKQPGGRCWVDHGRIRCTDDDGVKPGRGARKGECLSKYGATRCGYHCLAASGQVKCAKTPQGACMARYGRVVCWDPPRSRKGDPRARCVAKYGAIRCGYDCISRYGRVRCAKTPQGVCTAAYGRVTCWDPPAETDQKKSKRKRGR